MVTRRSASITASAQNSRAPSIIQSEVEDDQRTAGRPEHSSTDETTRSCKLQSSARRSDQSRSRASSAREKRKAEAPKLKLFSARPPPNVELQKLKQKFRGRKGAIPPTTQVFTDRNNNKSREAEAEDDERADVADTIIQGNNSTTLTVTTQLTESNKSKLEAGHHDQGVNKGEIDGPSLTIDVQCPTESNKRKRGASIDDEDETDVVDMAGVTDGEQEGTSPRVHIETPLKSNKRKREAGYEDEKTANVSDKTKGHNNATTSREIMEEPPAKRGGRMAKPKIERVNTSAEPTPAPEASNGKLELSTPATKRPPGRPRKGGPPVSRPGSETAARRLPGRQRAPDANPEVEATRIQMAALKRNYRVVARAQAAALDNLAERSIDELREGPNAHKQSGHFETVQAKLDAQFAENVTEREQNYQRRLEYEERKFEAQKEVLRRECKVRSSSVESSKQCADRL